MRPAAAAGMARLQMQSCVVGWMDGQDVEESLRESSRLIQPDPVKNLTVLNLTYHPTKSGALRNGQSNDRLSRNASMTIVFPIFRRFSFSKQTFKWSIN